jgi:spore maturation protein CgeB
MPEVTGAIRKAFDEGRVTREQFARGIEAILEPNLLAGYATGEMRNIELCLVYESTRRQRRVMVSALEPFGIEVRGDAGWAELTPRAGGPLNYFEDLAPYYRATAVNLNSTSLQMSSAVNQRVFDCPAAGGFLITDAQGDLEELFDPGTEVVTYSDLGELEEKVLFYLDHPEARAAVVDRAQRRIAAHHTHRHRLDALAVYLRERFAG